MEAPRTPIPPADTRVSLRWLPYLPAAAPAAAVLCVARPSAVTPVTASLVSAAPPDVVSAAVVPNVPPPLLWL